MMRFYAITDVMNYVFIRGLPGEDASHWFCHRSLFDLGFCDEFYCDYLHLLMSRSASVGMHPWIRHWHHGC